MRVISDCDLVALLLKLRDDFVYLLRLDLANLAYGFELIQKVILLHQQLL